MTKPKPLSATVAARQRAVKARKVARANRVRKKRAKAKAARYRKAVASENLWLKAYEKGYAVGFEHGKRAREAQE